MECLSALQGKITSEADKGSVGTRAERCHLLETDRVENGLGIVILHDAKLYNNYRKSQ